MNQRQIFIRQNGIFGLFIGISFILASYIFHLSGLPIYANPQLNNALLLLSIFGAFIGVRKYREEHLNGILSYSRALGSSIYMLCIASILYGIYIYILYTSIPELQENYLQTTLNMLDELYRDTPQLELEKIKSFMKILITPGFITASEVFTKIISSVFFSLFLAFLLRRKMVTHP